MGQAESKTHSSLMNLTWSVNFVKLVVNFVSHTSVLRGTSGQLEVKITLTNMCEGLLLVSTVAELLLCVLNAKTTTYLELFTLCYIWFLLGFPGSRLLSELFIPFLTNNVALLIIIIITSEQACLYQFFVVICGFY